jgi:hypothetical protein
MSKAEVYRLRLKGLLRHMKKATRTDRAVMQRKSEALVAMAENEDWLEGREKRPGALGPPDPLSRGN